ncbi:hypothetical protein [Stieleria varia]|uniref:Uncharacterized protein n=1 Tax=Stieleria varia TaxID=2528005 RepID=A0A5C6AYX3_9BACT|nr:hypothetical protein [Stieleria varia]TWU04880.1 hypothetical protein Pla52n_29250 [Stieleria varia]
MRPMEPNKRYSRRKLLLIAGGLGGLGLATGCGEKGAAELTRETVESLDTQTLENGKLLLRGFAIVSYMAGTRVIFLPSPGVRILGVALIFTSMATKLAVEYLDDELVRRYHTTELTESEAMAIESAGEVRFQTESGETETVALGKNQYVTVE